MYCPNCGAEVNEGAGFCPNCGAAIAAEPQQEPVFAAPVAPEAAPAAPAQRKPLIVPAILAAAAALLLLIGGVNGLRNIARYARLNPQQLPSMIQSVVGTVLYLTAAICAVLFCLLQYRKNKASLLGLSCLAIVFAELFSILFTMAFTLVRTTVRRAIVPAVSSSVSNTVIFSLIGMLIGFGMIVVFLIAAIGAFRGKVKKPVLIVGAVLMLLAQLVSVLMTAASIGMNYLTARNLATLLWVHLNDTLLAVAYLLIAVLSRPAEKQASFFNR